MDPNKNNQSMDDERKASITATMGCFILIAVVILAITVTIVAMYLQSIFTGSKEFLVQ